MKTVYLSLGSNIGDRASNLRAAMDLLAAPDLRILRVSPVYETEPVGCVEERSLTVAAPIKAPPS